MRIRLIASCLGLFAISLSACAADKLAKNREQVRTVAVKVLAGVKQVEIKGCAAAVPLLADYDQIKDLLPPGTEQEVGRYVAVAEPIIEELCTRVQMERPY